MREEIGERQNSEWSLDRLAAQRLLYGQAKSVENWRLGVILLVVVLLLSGLALESGTFSQAATVAVVLLWLVDQVVLAPGVVRKKDEAATIQEAFDCFVLDIPWPDHLGLVPPTGDRVDELARYARDAGVARSKLASWYPLEKVPVGAVAARLSCQRVNCRWDSRLRGEWISHVMFAVWGVAVVAIILGVVFGITLLEVVLGVAAGTRLLAWLMLERRAQLAARNRVVRLHEYLSRPEDAGGPMTMNDVRLVQAVIFEHRRTCPTVPDCYYWFRRKAYEGTAES